MSNNEIAQKVAQKLYRPNIDEIDYATQLLIEKLVIPETLKSYTIEQAEKLILEKLESNG